MRPQFNFHRRTGLTPSFGFEFVNWGPMGCVILRLWWSALTFAFDIPKRYQKVEDDETRFYRECAENFARREA
jgi:hypothetical protein